VDGYGVGLLALLIAAVLGFKERHDMAGILLLLIGMVTFRSGSGTHGVEECISDNGEGY
jgi:hypothetical protein